MQLYVQTYFLGLVLGFLLVTGFVVQNVTGWINALVSQRELGQVTQVLASENYLWVWLPRAMESRLADVSQLINLVK
jgi:hypothetical protein